MKICVQRYDRCALVSVLLMNASLQKKKRKNRLRADSRPQKKVIRCKSLENTKYLSLPGSFTWQLIFFSANGC